MFSPFSGESAYVAGRIYEKLPSAESLPDAGRAEKKYYRDCAGMRIWNQQLFWKAVSQRDGMYTGAVPEKDETDRTGYSRETAGQLKNRQNERIKWHDCAIY